MRLTCALCGRSMRQAAVSIGAMSIGPKCARRAGLIDLGRKKAGFVRLVAQKVERDVRTPDLFDEVEA